MPPARLPHIIIVAAVALPAVRAGAQTGAPQDDSRPRAALGACAAGEVSKGVAILAELYAETRDPTFVFNQARCYQQNGKLEPARERFREYLRVGKTEPPEDIHRAEGYLKEIDDTLVRQAPPPAAPVVVAAPTPGPSEGDSHAHTLRMTSLALAVIGVTAVGTGVYMSVKVQSTTHDVEARFANMGVVTDPQALQRQLSDGGRYETWQWISYGVGVAALAGAATTFLVAGFPSAHGAEKAAVAFAPIATPGQVGGVMSLRF